MAFYTKPFNFKGFIVIVVMHLGISPSTRFTRLGNKFTIPNGVVGITAGLYSLFLFCFG